MLQCDGFSVLYPSSSALALCCHPASEKHGGSCRGERLNVGKPELVRQIKTARCRSVCVCADEYAPQEEAGRERERERERERDFLLLRSLLLLKKNLFQKYVMRKLFFSICMCVRG